MNNTRPVVEGGLLTAITVILGLGAVYVPVFGVFIEFFSAVPIVVLTVRQGFGKGFISLTASFILLTMFLGPLLSMRIVLSFGVCGLVLGFCIRRGFGAVKSFSASLMAAFFAQVIAVGILTFAMGIDVLDVEMTSVQETFEESFKMYETLGVDQKTIDEARAQVAPTLEVMKVLMPMMLMLMALLNAAACYLTAQWIFKKLRMKFVAPMPPFKEWRFPTAILYLASFAILGVYWGGTRGWTLIYTISINATFFTMSVGLLQGLAVLSCAADKYKISKFVRRLVFVIIILNMLTLELVAFTGLFDMIFDYRKRWLER